MTQKTPKTPIIYDCNYCEFVSCNKKDYKRHLSTRKHKMMTNDDAKKPYIYSCDCGNKYKYRQGLFNHKKKCKNICKLEDSELESKVGIVLDVESISETQPIQIMFSEMKKENKEMRQELQKMLLVQQEKHQEEIHQFQEETYKQMLELANESNKVIYNNNNTNNNTINNRFNMNFFLNEQCKDAMNLTDFLNNIEVSLEDVSNVGRLGYADGISRIIINALKDMDVYERPIHCSDIKREIMYIKDNDIWEKDDERKYQMKRVLKLISHKNVKRLLDWREAHPGWLVYDSKEEAECLRITNESMGGASDEENERLYKKMIRRIAHETLIDKKLVE